MKACFPTTEGCDGHSLDTNIPIISAVELVPVEERNESELRFSRDLPQWMVPIPRVNLAIQHDRRKLAVPEDRVDAWIEHAIRDRGRPAGSITSF